jgi:hypothetical protein
MALGATGLALVLPNGTAAYVALGTACDQLAGTFTEVSDSGYARVSHSAWVTQVTTTAIVRKNNGAIVFAALADGVKEVVWWGIFDAAVAGNLLAAGPMKNGSGDVEPLTVGVGDQVRFSDGELKLVATPEVA